jgi:hypothetical protein
MPNVDLEHRRNEFFQNVWNHAEDPFQIQFDDRRPLTRDENTFIEETGRLVHSTLDDHELGKKLFRLVNGSAEKLGLLLQVCGLTRNKIISDLKAAAISAKPRVVFPSSYVSLAGNKDAWTLAGPYMAIRLRRVLGSLPIELLHGAAEALNQATWPGFIRQERAKRSGHEGEYRLATLLVSSGIPFQPEEKADNPICPDVQIYNVSFDVVVPSVDAPQVCFKATVHTANIGQYGESKDYLEIMEAHQVLNEKFPKEGRPLLMALIDGIGFSSNRAGLDGVLSVADEFCQYRTIWKSIVVCSAMTGIPLLIELPRAIIEQRQDFLERFNFLKSVVARENGHQAKLRIPAGEGAVLLDRPPS